MPNCQECNTPIPIEEEMPDLGDVLVCPSCGAEHETISTDPVKLEIVEEEK
jgi:alpha-aminoadipate carrier protein LysW